MSAKTLPLPLWHSAMKSALACRPSHGLLLAEGQLYARDLALGETLEVCLRRGTAWLTLEGDPTDHVLQEGERMTFVGAGKLVLEPLEGPVEFTWKILLRSSMNENERGQLCLKQRDSQLSH